MICTVHQPNYLPYLGFFDKALRSDVFILYDTTQFKKNDWQNRNKICSKSGWQWISIPILHDFGQKIFEVKIDHLRKPLIKNWFTIKTIYGRAPYFKQYSSVFEKIYCQDFIFISDLNCELIIAIAGILDLKTKFVRSSGLPEINTKSTEALIELCKHVNADTYISGSEGRNYLNSDLFESKNIELLFQNYQHPEYVQFNSPTFQPYMSTIDLIFNCGPESLRVITSGKT